MIAPRSTDGHAAALPIRPEVADRTDTEDVKPEAPLTRRVLDKDGAGAFVDALFLDLRDGPGGVSPSTASSTAEVESTGSPAVPQLGAGLADGGTKGERTGTDVTDGVSGPRTALAPLVRRPVSGPVSLGHF